MQPTPAQFVEMLQSLVLPMLFLAFVVGMTLSRTMRGRTPTPKLALLMLIGAIWAASTVMQAMGSRIAEILVYTCVCVVLTLISLALVAIGKRFFPGRQPQLQVVRTK